MRCFGPDVTQRRTSLILLGVRASRRPRPRVCVRRAPDAGWAVSGARAVVRGGMRSVLMTHSGTADPGRFRAAPIRRARSDSKRARSASNAGALLGSLCGRLGSCRSIATPGCIARIKARIAWLAVRRAPVFRRSSSTSAVNAASASGDSTNSRLMVASVADRRGRGASAGLAAGATCGPGPTTGAMALFTLGASRSLASDEVGLGVWSALAITASTLQASWGCSRRPCTCSLAVSPRGTTRDS